MSEITQVLQAIQRGDGRASEELLPLVYKELHQLAAARMHQEAAGQTLRATPLAQKARLRMVGGKGPATVPLPAPRIFSGCSNELLTGEPAEVPGASPPLFCQASACIPQVKNFQESFCCLASRFGAIYYLPSKQSMAQAGKFTK